VSPFTFPFTLELTAKNGGCLHLIIHLINPSGGLAYENPEDLLPLVDRLVANPELRQSLGENGRKEFVSQYTEERWIERYFGFIQMYADANCGTP
jgi:glycosyltransferase involved in cell wall biosynthesis